MTPERLKYLIESCFAHQRGRPHQELEVHYRNVARFLGVEPQTLRRWRTGETTIPRPIEIIMEVLHAYPQVTADAVNNIIRARDEETSKT